MVVFLNSNISIVDSLFQSLMYGKIKSLSLSPNVIFTRDISKDIRPNIVLLNVKFLTKNYILNILMIYSQVLLSAKFIICDGHWKQRNLRKYIKARE